MKKIFFSLLAVAALTACTNDESLTENNINDDNRQSETTGAHTYQVSIPATMPDDGTTRAVSIDGTTCTSTFSASEKVYVYNATTREMLDGTLQPSNITADGKGCDLTGSLTGTIEAGNELRLFYNPNGFGYSDPSSNAFSYYSQDGTPSGLRDGAEAAVTVSSYTGGVLKTMATAQFQPVQSVFRFKFVDENNTAINVKTLQIESKKSALVTYYPPLGTYSSCDTYAFTFETATTDYIYMAIRIDESSSNRDELTFTATDNDGNLYKGTKAAPAGGFKNGKYYYNTSAIQLTKQGTLVAPTIIWTSVNAPVSPNEYNCYNVYGPWVGEHFTPSEITISGTSDGYYFYMSWGATIHLYNLTATYDEEFIYSSAVLNLDINGTNSISCKNFNQAIWADETLKLSGNGTLTVTAKSQDRKGIHGSNYGDSTNSDASVLAADGYTVTRSDMTDNGNGTYTWTYTVKPSN